MVSSGAHSCRGWIARTSVANQLNDHRALRIAFPLGWCRLDPQPTNSAEFKKTPRSPSVESSAVRVYERGQLGVDLLV